MLKTRESFAQSESKWICDLCETPCTDTNNRKLEVNIFKKLVFALSYDLRLFWGLAYKEAGSVKDTICIIRRFFYQAALTNKAPTIKQRNVIKEYLRRFVLAWTVDEPEIAPTNQNEHISKKTMCFIDGMNVTKFKNPNSPCLSYILKVLEQLKQRIFHDRDVSYYVVVLPWLRHRISASEKVQFEQLYQDGKIIQSFSGKEKDDIFLLQNVETNLRKGHDVWVVTNDNYKNHLNDFPWYKDFKNKIEFRFVEDELYLNPWKPPSKVRN